MIKKEPQKLVKRRNLLQNYITSTTKKPRTKEENQYNKDTSHKRRKLVKKKPRTKEETC